ncbi:hypothetical protein SDC9_53387 [bioreactor metagenome]|uniref:Uncharacterized protein n=1 Tax=bioreactor metagenome TaxID=1076179 RepID=A0A644WU32_9ZZZZ
MKNIILFAAIFSSVLLSAFAQEAEYVVKLTNKTNPEKIRYLKEGRRIKIFSEDNSHHAGRLVVPSDSTLKVDDKIFQVDDIPKIRGNSTGLLVAKIAGGALGAFGIMLAVAGTSIIVDALASNSLAVIILVPIGVITVATGFIVASAGSSVLFINGMKYDLRDKWDISIVPASEFSK